MTKLGDRFTRCPKAFARDDAPLEMQLLRDVALYKSSNLPPRAGGLLDQDSIFVDALEVYETGLDDFRTWQARQQA